MGLFSFKKKTFFSETEKEEIIHAIQVAEKETSGEIRLYVESKNYLVSPVERAKEIFFHLKMEKTKHRNGVLIYLAVEHREVAVFADEGIYNSLDKNYWNSAVEEMLHHFKQGNIKNGVVHAVLKIGDVLKEKFPGSDADKNELPDDIVFGK